MQNLTVECLIQEEYSQISVFRFAASNDRLPKDSASPICADMDMTTRSVIYNYTKPKGGAKDEPDRYSGTLSPAALQTIMEYTTRPGDVVVTFNAQFGAIYEAVENYGRMVFASEYWDHLEMMRLLR